jgi:hypothetical protein
MQAEIILKNWAAWKLNNFSDNILKFSNVFLKYKHAVIEQMDLQQAVWDK